MIRQILLLVCCLPLAAIADATLDCPEGTTLKGDAPPKGRELRCENADGKLHGPYKRWYGNGQLNQLMHYQDGIEHGQQEAWWPNGNPMMRGISVNGERFKGYEYFDMNGNKINVEFKEHNQ
jgi:hypothetical protein